MTAPSRIAKRLILPVLLAATFVVVQVVLAAPPSPSFDVSGPAGNECGTYTFTSTSTDPDNDIETIDWNLGGTPAMGSPVQATFGSPGPRLITMSATDGSAGDADTGPETVPAAPQTVNVVNAGAPNAAVTATPTNPQPNQVITFNAASSSDQGSGTIAKYEWDLDENGSYETDTGTTASTTAAFAAAGTHTVGLRVTDNCGTPDTGGVNVFVSNTPPTASFTATPNPAAIGAAVTFNATASADPGGSIAKYEWDFDGDGVFETDTLTAATTTHSYTVSGQYFVGLRVTDNDGAQATAFRNVRVNAKPTASFTADPNPALINEPVTFSAATSSDSDGTIATYQWDLDGNGTLETTGATPAHAYATAGTVNVKLRVTDNNGAFEEITRPVTVQLTRPNAALTFTPQNPTPGEAVTLTSTSTPSVSPGAPALEATQWDFDYTPLADFTLDGAGGSIVTSFATAGPHTVAVKVTETGGGFAIGTATIVVNAPPQASFTVAPAKPLEGREVTFASTSSDPDGPLVKQEWDLNNDGKYERSGAVVSSTTMKKGTRPVRLRVTDSKGATTTSTVPVTVGAKPLKPPVDVKRSIGWAPRDWGIELVALIVKVPSKTTVTVRCAGRGCPRGTFKKRTGKKKGRLVFDKLHGSVRAGAKITVVSSRKGHITAFDTYLVRGNKRSPLLREQCKWGAKKKPRACPSA
jgi:PKD repeat protein